MKPRNYTDPDEALTMQRLKELLSLTPVSDRGTALVELPRDDYPARLLAGAIGSSHPFTFTPRLHRGQALIMGDDALGGRTIFFGTLLARGVPYRIVGGTARSTANITIERCYVLEQNTESSATVLDARTGRVHELYFAPDMATRCES